METKINIAEILRNKPRGIKLYSPIFGDCTYCHVCEDTNDICVKKHNGVIEYFNSEGLYFALGEVMLFPSKEMRDWSKFLWKKGDVLVSNGYSKKVIFYDWYDDTYTNFYGKHLLYSEDKNNIKYNNTFICTTGRYYLEDKDAAQTYIKTIEERLCGKLNRETLEVEKAQPEFKDGDIAFADYGNKQYIFIVTGRTSSYDGYTSFISLDLNHMTLSLGCKTSFFKKDLCELRLATEEEKIKLFDALTMEGKYWDAEKKQIVDLKPKCEFKPFDKVIVRCSKADKWSIDFFSYKVSNGYICTGDAWFGYCLPYNEETSHLLGTTDDWEGGEQ